MKQTLGSKRASQDKQDPGVTKFAIIVSLSLLVNVSFTYGMNKDPRPHRASSISPERKQNLRNRLLKRAVESGELTQVEERITRGGDITIELLKIAVEKSYVSIIEKLLGSGNFTKDDLDTIHSLANQGNNDTIKQLLANHLQLLSNPRPLEPAATTPKTETTSPLPSKTSTHHTHSRNRDDEEFIQDEPTQNLEKALRSEHTVSFGWITEANADVNAVSPEDGCTMLELAVQTGKIDFVRALLQKKATANAKGTAGSTALAEAACRGFTDIVSLLLENNANPHTQDDRGHTAIAEAAYNGQKETVKVLIPHGNEAELRQALKDAGSQNHDEIVTLLEEALTKFDIAPEAMTEADNNLKETLSLPSSQPKKEPSDSTTPPTISPSDKEKMTPADSTSSSAAEKARKSLLPKSLTRRKTVTKNSSNTQRQNNTTISNRTGSLNWIALVIVGAASLYGAKKVYEWWYEDQEPKDREEKSEKNDADDSEEKEGDNEIENMPLIEDEQPGTV